MNHRIFSSRSLGRGALARLVLLGLLFGAMSGWLAPASAGNKWTWTGSVDNKWSNPNNWSPVGIPQNGDYVEFLEGADNNETQNDLVGLVLSSVSFGHHGVFGTDHRIDGNALTITSDLYNGFYFFGANASFVTVINCPLIITNNVTIRTGHSTGKFTETTQDIELNGPITVNGGTLSLIGQAADDNGGANGHIFLSGTISGSGNVDAYAFDAGGHKGSVEFRGSVANTFSGTLYLETDGLTEILLHQSAGFVATNGVFIKGGKVQFTAPDQIGHQAVVTINAGALLSLNGFNATARNLVLTNFSSDALSSTLDTGGGTFTLNGGIEAWSDSDSVRPTIKGKLDLPAGNHFFDLNNSGYEGLTMQAQITGSGGFEKLGNAALLLPTSNTYSGLTIVSEGIVDVSNGRAFGAGANGVQLNGGTVTLRNAAVTAEPMTVNSSLSSLIGFGTCTWGGSITLNQQLTVYGDSISLAGSMVGPGDLFLIGPAVELSGSSANTFTGTTYANCTLLTLNKAPTGTAYVFSGPFVIAQGSFAPVTVRWLNDFQIDRATANVTLYSNALMNLNGHNDALASIIFNGGTIQNSGAGSLTVIESITSHVASGTANINGGGLALNFNGEIVDVESSTVEPGLAINASIYGFGGFTKTGTGTLRLSGPNGFEGAVNVSDGVLHVQSATALGITNAGTMISSGATLRVENVAALAEPLTLGGTLELLPLAGVQAGIVLASNAFVRVDSSVGYLTGPMSGVGPLTKVGLGQLELGLGSGSANTYSGDTYVNAGQLLLFKPTGVTAVPGHLIVGTSQILGPAATVRHLSSFQVVGSITLNRGLWDLNGQSEGFSIPALEGRPPLTLNGGADVQTGSGFLYLPVGGDVVVNPGTVNNASSVISGNIGLDPGTHHFAVSGATFILGGIELDVSAAINQTSLAADLVKDGVGQMRLSASNNFTGAVTVSGGTLIVSNNFALGASAGGTTVTNDGALVLDGTRVVNNEALTLNSMASAALVSNGGSNVWNGPITLARDSGIAVNVSYLQALGSVSGAGGLTKLGAGTLQFGGSAANTYGGVTTVSNGTIECGRVNGTSIPGNAFIGDDSAGTTTAILRAVREQQFSRTARFTIHRSGLLDLLPGVTAPQVTLNSVLGAGKINLGVFSLLTISNDVSFAFDGILSGSGDLNKRGPATFRLNGDSPGFSGTTAVFDGTYKVDGNMSNSFVIVKANATLRGAGIVGGVSATEQDAVMRADSKAPGHQGGQLEMASLTMANGGVVGLSFFGPSPTGGNDSIVVRGGATLNNARLSLGFLYPPHEGDVITVLQKKSAGAPSGIFSGFAEGTTRKVGDVTVRASYVGGDGNDFTLTVTNTAMDISGYRLAEGNGNQTVEPNECNLLFLTVVNRRTNALTITNAFLRAVTPGAVVTIASASYPNFPAGAARTNTTPFQFRTDATLACGSSMEFELVLGVAGEGAFAIPFVPVSGNDCSHPTGPCESCTVASGRFTMNSLTTAAPLYFVGGPSLCFPSKVCPGIDLDTNNLPAPYITHTFANTTTNELCLTAQLKFGCAGAPTNVLGAAAYLGEINFQDPCADYLGDSGADGSAPFSFRVPAGSNFVVLVSARMTNLVCSNYALELFGLPCPPPTLAISREAAPSEVRLQWSTAYPGWTAQEISKIGNTFSNVAQTPSIVVGRYALTNIIATSNQFFRLKL